MLDVEQVLICFRMSIANTSTPCQLYRDKEEREYVTSAGDRASMSLFVRLWEGPVWERLLLSPSRLSRYLGNLAAFFRSEALGSGLPTLQSTSASFGRMSLGFANRILSFANSNVEYLLGKLDGITRTFGHEASIAQAAPTIYTMKFQTEALPGGQGTRKNPRPMNLVFIRVLLLLLLIAYMKRKK